MTPENFCYWLQGYFEIDGNQPEKGYSLNPNQILMIRDHLRSVVYKKATKDEKDGLHVSAIGPGWGDY